MEKIDFYAAGIRTVVYNTYDFWLIPRPREILVPVFRDLRNWNVICKKNVLWKQLPKELFEIIAQKLFYFETKYKCQICNEIVDEINVACSCLKKTR